MGDGYHTLFDKMKKKTGTLAATIISAPLLISTPANRCRSFNPFRKSCIAARNTLSSGRPGERAALNFQIFVLLFTLTAYGIACCFFVSP